MLGIGLASCGVPDRSPNIVLISIDSLRADRLGIYGADRDTSPAIDALAAEGALFETAVAPSPWTLASHVTLFTGMPISTHRVSAPDKKLDSARRPLAQHLAELGYKTAAFVSAPFLDRAYGVDRGFETYVNFQGVDTEAFPPTPAAHQRSHRDRSASEVVDAALAWMKNDAAGPQPWFLFVHIWDVHFDYDPPAPYDSMFDPDYTGNLDARFLNHNPAVHAGMSTRDLNHIRALYDGEIRWVDSQLDRLFVALRQRERSEPILISLVADHGEEFYEHGNKSHFKTLFDESLRVPWIVRYPGVVEPGIRIGGVAGLEDVAPTLIGLAGLAPLAEASGHNLEGPLKTGGKATRPQLLHFGLQRGLRGPDWKVTYRTDTKEALHYDLNLDPLEQAPKPAAEAAPKRLARLLNRLNKAYSTGETLHWDAPSELDLDPSTSERLRDLGYIE